MKKLQTLFVVFCLCVTVTAFAIDRQKADALFDKGEYRQALAEYLNPSLQNDPSVQTRIGWLYEKLQDDKKSADWYKKAADQGYANAQFNLGMSYEEGKGVSKDYGKAMTLYQNAAKQGHAKAHNAIGGLYEDGLGVSQNYKEAAKWYGKGAELNAPIAMCNLAALQTFGKGVSKDYAKAREMLDNCLNTNRDDTCCLGRMADLYRYGWGVRQDHAKANEYQSRAAALGSGLAMFSLGVSYDYGFAVEKDAAAALRWYEKGAAVGDARSMYRLYEVYEYGRLGQSVDKAKAKEWLAKAEPAMKAQNVTRSAMKDQLRLMMEN